MALEGNGNYVFDDLTNYNKVSTNSAPNYQTSSASWHSAIVGCVVNMNHHSSVQATTQCSFRPVNSSYNLDETLAIFSPSPGQSERKKRSRIVQHSFD